MNKLILFAALITSFNINAVELPKCAVKFIENNPELTSKVFDLLTSCHALDPICTSDRPDVQISELELKSAFNQKFQTKIKVENKKITFNEDVLNTYLEGIYCMGNMVSKVEYNH